VPVQWRHPSLGVVFVIVWELCLLLCGGYVCNGVGGCVCNSVGVVFVIVWGLCFLLCGVVFVVN